MVVPHRTPPNNDHDVGLALWHAVIGTNGSGLMTQVKEMRVEVSEIHENQKNFVTKNDCHVVQAVPMKKRRSRWLMSKDIVLIFASLTGIISGVVAVLIALGLLHIGV